MHEQVWHHFSGSMWNDGCPRVPIQFTSALLVIFMLSSLCKAFGMEPGPTTPQYQPRQVSLAGNQFHFALPEDFSRDMPADDLVLELDIDDLSLLDNPANGTLIRRWWDIKDDSFFRKNIGTVMLEVAAVRVPDNKLKRLDETPYDISDRLQFITAIEEFLHNRYREHNSSLTEDNKRNFSYSLPSISYLVGSKFGTEFIDITHNQQKWTRYSLTGPNDQLLVCFALPVTEQVILEAVFTYSPNQGVFPRELRDFAYQKTNPIEQSFLVEFEQGNPFEKVVGEYWLNTDTNQVLEAQRDT